MVTHVSEPSKIIDESWIKAGRSSWSWWSDTQCAKNYDKLKSFVDLAVDMCREYSLVVAKQELIKLYPDILLNSQINQKPKRIDVNQNGYLRGGYCFLMIV
jgi:hypothetical protein